MFRAIPISLFRILDVDEEEDFRQWARDWYDSHPGDDPDPLWHPVVRAEIRRLRDQVITDEEAGQ